MDEEARAPRPTTSSAEPDRRPNRSSDLQRRSVRDEELRQLESEIRKAYLLKALHAQLAEQEADRVAAEVQARLADKIASTCAAVESEEHRHEREATRKRRVGDLRAALELQLEQKRLERSLAEEEERKERRLLIEVDRLREEQEQAERAITKDQLEQQLLLEQLAQKEMRELNKQRQRELEAELEERNRRFAGEIECRAERLKVMRREARRKREEAACAVAKTLLDLQSDREERQRLLQEILVEEVRYEAELEAREAELRRRQKQRDIAEALKEQIRFEEECKRRFLQREKELADSIMVQVMESRKMEQLTEETRRRRRVAYREELERLMGERERARSEELARLRVALEEEHRQEETAREAARKERMELLERHVEHIADFMSRKSLYDEERGIVAESLRSKKE